MFLVFGIPADDFKMEGRMVDESENLRDMSKTRIRHCQILENNRWARH